MNTRRGFTLIELLVVIAIVAILIGLMLPRRSDIIESLHDGSWFHDRARLVMFHSAGVVLVVLRATGMYLFLLPYAVRWRRARKHRTP